MNQLAYITTADAPSASQRIRGCPGYHLAPWESVVGALRGQKKTFDGRSIGLSARPSLGGEMCDAGAARKGGTVFLRGLLYRARGGRVVEPFRTQNLTLPALAALMVRNNSGEFGFYGTQPIVESAAVGDGDTEERDPNGNNRDKQRGGLDHL